jgi:ribonuclease HIII
MQELIRVHDSTLLTQSKIYQIDRTLYQFSHRSSTDSGSKYYHFKPLSGQRKKATLVLNHNKLITRCYELEGAKINSSVISQESLQLSIF